MSTAPRAVPPALNSWSPEYLEAQYQQYQQDPSSVSADLRLFFAGFDLALAGSVRLAGEGEPPPPAPVELPSQSPVPIPAQVPGQVPGQIPAAATPVSANGARIEASRAIITPVTGQPAGRASHWQAVVDDLIGAFRDHGHLAARLDPFGRHATEPDSLSLGYHGMQSADLDRPVDATAIGYQGETPLREVMDRLRTIYCGSIGVEFMHIQDDERRGWLIDRFESSGGGFEMTRGEKAHLLELLTRSELFERFLGKRYPGEKRFSLEGSESLIPLLDKLLETASDLGVEEVVLGMAHRGRLNVLNNTLGKSYQQIFTEFEEAWLDDYEDGGGDVKYHRGYSGTRRYPNGRMLHLAMASNPSHLEAVDPVVLGRCRAKQALRADSERSRVIPVLMHGDAAIVGQGVVAECLNFSELEGYTTGGTVHVVVNNQIGFTTIPEDGRSSRYCTDIGKAIDAPIFHVNGEDPEAVVSVARFAMEYRQEFQRDVFIDLQCYRKFGHNEQDEASFTQPLLVKRIKDKQSVLTMYAERLLAEQVINQADVHAIRLRLDEALNQAQKLVKESPHDPTIDPGSARWAGMTQEFEFGGPETGIGRETLAEICDALSKVPDGFNINRKLEKLLKQRGELKDGGELSHADAELLAFGSLLLEGHPIRLSGQDSRRGTFSQRHAVLRDSESGEPYIPINHMRDLGVLGTDAAPGSEGDDGRARQAKLSVLDSPLSEFGVLGFEYGYSLADPDGLVLWEAQFGDFVNGAQVIIDQFIASAEQKWERWSGLVMLLPHGYEGQGPEHSSARLERFLELCGASNVQVAYPSTGPQMFHLLRRQLKRGFRKPLVVMTPKSYLRVPTGTIDEVLAGSFREIFDDPRAGKEIDRKRVERIVLCSGKLYHELAERRDAREQWDTAIVRVEQLYPFHTELARSIIESYQQGAELVYAQEEPRNMGAYLHVADRVETELGRPRPRYIGRPASASPAVGSKKVHKQEQEAVISEAVGPPAEPAGSAERKTPASNKRSSGGGRRRKVASK